MTSLKYKIFDIAGSLCRSPAGDEISEKDDLTIGRDLYLKQNPIAFEVNGKTITLDTSNVSTESTLANYLRYDLGLTGTKINCAEGGCGSCVVNASFVDPASGQRKSASVNACIVPVMKCDGWKITTVEGLGNKEDGLSKVQKALPDFHGTQCGYCSPGMVMAMNGLMINEQAPTLADVEQALDGNICRCTGYRSILDAFYSLTPNPPESVKSKIADIEDMMKTEGRMCPSTNKLCPGKCSSVKEQGKIKVPGPQSEMQYIKTANGTWMKPETLADLIVMLNEVQSGEKYRLVAGNTGVGVFKDGPYDLYFDISAIPELTSVSALPTELIVGGAVSLSDLMSHLENQADSFPVEFGYCRQIARHLKRVANSHVRNIGTIAGNLMLKHDHPEFPSDVFILFSAVGASINVTSGNGSSIFQPVPWLAESMDKKVLLSISLPALTSQHIFYSYKTTPRPQNAHAYVNGAFLMKVQDPGINHSIVEKPSLVFGGISADFNHATAAEDFLSVGANLNDQSILQTTLDILDQEAVPDSDPVLANTEYRSHLVKALYYKFVLFALGSSVDITLQSGATEIMRNPSTGKTEYETEPDQYPISEPVLKLEGQSQCTGESKFADDLPLLPDEVFAAYVLAKVGNCDLESVNPGPALAMPGVIDFVNASDIPGANSTTGNETVNAGQVKEEIFSSGRVHYAGQAIGLIIAKTREEAESAAKAVDISYTNQEPPVLTIRDAIGGEQITKDLVIKQTSLSHKSKDILSKDASKSVQVQGELEVGSQYHFYMECHTVVVRPLEEGEYDVISSTQHMDWVQFVTARALNIDMNKINVKVKRVGGAYGGKVTRAAPISAACAIAAKKLRRPVRLALNLETNMELMGKRCPYLFQYTASIDDSNKISGIDLTVYVDAGFSGLEPESSIVQLFLQNGYYIPSLVFNPNDVLTNTAGNTIIRAPFLAQSHGVMETMMEHLAFEAGLDPLDFRLSNLLSPGDSMIGSENPFAGPNLIPNMVNDLKIKADYEARKSEVAAFNANNAWKKRGLSLIPMRWPIQYFGEQFSCQVAIYAGDGTVSVTGGGVDNGSGLNTRVAQVVAKAFEVPLEKISVKPSNSFIGNNNSSSSGSRASMLTSSAALKACEDLKTRMKPIADSMSGASWVEIVQACKNSGVDLTGRATSFPPGDGNPDYDIFGAALTEVELDILTGEKTIRRTDIIEDTGRSINPELDVGQIHGAYTIGIGLWTQEEYKYDSTSGRVLTRNTWEYKPPFSQDIPETFNLTLYNSRETPFGTLGAKATGEPPTLLAFATFLALRNAINEAKKDLGQQLTFFSMNAPATHEKLQGLTGVTSANFRL